MKNNRKLQIQHIKKYEKSIKSLDTYVEEEYLENGKAIIYINLENNDYYNPLSFYHQLELTNEIYEYIDDKIYYVPAKYPVMLRFVKNEIEESDQLLVRSLIREHFTKILQDKRLDLKYNT